MMATQTERGNFDACLAEITCRNHFFCEVDKGWLNPAASEQQDNNHDEQDKTQAAAAVISNSRPHVITAAAE